mmetsp:Transcript_6781/g.16361  ORF Transcript_6781/g.16361 Transcript_6781/m.16361 type:complete len:294 (-) Transcript_6781:218-1099(-)
MVRLEEQYQRRDHHQGEHADVEHDLVARVEEHRGGERDDVSRLAVEEEEGYHEVKQHPAPCDEPREEGVGVQPPPGLEPHDQRLRPEQPVVVHLGERAVQVGDAEEEPHREQVPPRHARVPPPPEPREDGLVEAHPPAPPDEGPDEQDVAHQEVVVVVVGLADVEEPGEGEPHDRRRRRRREADELQDGGRGARPEEDAAAADGQRADPSHAGVREHHVGRVELDKHVLPLGELSQDAQRVEHAEHGDRAAVDGDLEPRDIALQERCQPLGAVPRRGWRGAFDSLRDNLSWRG